MKYSETFSKKRVKQLNNFDNKLNDKCSVELDNLKQSNNVYDAFDVVIKILDKYHDINTYRFTVDKLQAKKDGNLDEYMNQRKSTMVQAKGTIQTTASYLIEYYFPERLKSAKLYLPLLMFFGNRINDLLKQCFNDNHSLTITPGY